MAKDEVKTKEPQPGFNEAGERVVVTLKEAGEKRYRAISQAVMGGSVPLLPLNLKSYAPDISLAGIKPEVRAEVEAILSKE